MFTMLMNYWQIIKKDQLKYFVRFSLYTKILQAHGMNRGMFEVEGDDATISTLLNYTVVSMRWDHTIL